MDGGRARRRKERQEEEEEEEEDEDEDEDEDVEFITFSKYEGVGNALIKHEWGTRVGREPVSTCGDCDTRKMQFRWMRPLHRRIRFGPSRVGSKNRKRNAADPEFPLIGESEAKILVMGLH
ncbi:hypothetical protein EAI_01784 [Harpegnathos saltator]|uniref:Uncharacterized protein n=1 Tax=Harpegnathos saltator TaxID=610380 RepID=E2BBT4_HARSA|nr:hypothetical protein EAI_01784 [Harpegnathos saltator]